MTPRTLHLTSPMMYGPDVAQFQASALDNRFGNFFEGGELDGIYGEQTAAAAKRTRFWLGYPETGANTWHNGVVGPRLMKILLGNQNLPPEYLARREIRLHQRLTTPLRARALAIARSKIGEKEDPAKSNICFASNWYGAIGRWCAMFVTYCYEFGGPSEAFDKTDARYAYVPFMVADARAGKNYLAITSAPKPGDISCYRFNSPEWRHTGLFESWSGSGSFQAIEGNTSITSQDNGGAVMRRRRQTMDGVIFIHVGK